MKHLETKNGTPVSRLGFGAMQFGKVQPQAIQLEEVVIGAILIDKNALPSVMDILNVDTFYKQAHQECRCSGRTPTRSSRPS